MAWDFSTEPEFEEKLEWMRTFVREEIEPLETLDLDYDTLRRVTDPLKEQVRAQGLWAAHLPPELGGGGFGQVKLGLMHEILGRCVYAPSIFGNNAPDSGNSELISEGGTEEQKEQWMRPLLDGKLRSAFSMTEPGAGADPTLLATSAVRDGDEWVINGHKWFTSNGSTADFLIVMAVTNPDVHPYQGSSMFLVPVDTPGRADRARRARRWPSPTTSPASSAATPRSSTRTSASRSRTSSAARPASARASRSPRSGSAPAGSTTRCAGSARASGPSTCCASARCRATRTAPRWPRSRWSRTGSPPRPPRCRRRGSSRCRRRGRWTRSARRSRRVEIAMIKWWGAKVLYEVIDRAIQVHGSLGYTTDLPLESMYRHARAARIYDGPDEVHKVTIARQVLKRLRRRRGARASTCPRAEPPPSRSSATCSTSPP